jgi:exosome complex component RRP41
MSAELVNISGLRVDGRRPGELRAVRCAMGVLPGRDGSALLAQGTRAGTRVLAAVTGPAARRGGDASDVAALDVEFW